MRVVVRAFCSECVERVYVEYAISGEQSNTLAEENWSYTMSGLSNEVSFAYSNRSWAYREPGATKPVSASGTCTYARAVTAAEHEPASVVLQDACMALSKSNTGWPIMSG